MCAGEALSVLSDASSVILGLAPKAGCPFMFSLKLSSVVAWHEVTVDACESWGT